MVLKGVTGDRGRWKNPGKQEETARSGARQFCAVGCRLSAVCWRFFVALSAAGCSRNQWITGAEPGRWLRTVLVEVDTP
jgi:hypothetical protein